ncbi:MAG: hypothetical protein WC236_01650 [Gallionellaceae bacterium]
MNRKEGFWAALWVALVVVTGYLAFGDTFGGRMNGPGYGWGYGYQDEVGPGYIDPGETLYGRGAGRYDGMRGPYAMPGGAYGSMPLLPQNLTVEQDKQISKIQSEAEERNRKLTQQYLDAQAQMNKLYASEKRDWNAIRSAARAVVDLQRQKSDSNVEVQQKIDALLTDTQRHELMRAWHGYGWQGGQ